MPDEGSERSQRWSGRKVLVTGAGGFIGSHLAELMARSGADVRAFVRYTSRGDHGWLEDVAPDAARAIEVFRGDLANPEAVRSAMEGCEVVFHLGALIPIPYSYLHPREFVTANVEATLNVLEAARRDGPARIVLTSTSEVYGTAQTRPDRRGAPAPPAVAVRGVEGRGRPARALVPALLRDAGRRRAPVQHLRAAAERSRRDPDDRHAGADARRGRARRNRSDARLPLRRRTPLPEWPPALPPRASRAR